MFWYQFWAHLYKGQLTLSNESIAIQRISDCKTYGVIHRIDFYQVDSAIQPSNNWDLIFLTGKGKLENLVEILSARTRFNDYVFSNIQNLGREIEI